jgi:alpha-glucosidase
VTTPDGAGRLPWPDLLGQPHHDGSPLHLEADGAAIGDTVAVRLQVPHDEARGEVDAVWVRSTPDAEPRFVDARVDRRTDTDTWWVAELRLDNPVIAYRFHVWRGGRAEWVNGAGVTDRDVADAADFRVATHAPVPTWVPDAIGYQIFPDRFAVGVTGRTPPDWATPAAWDDPVDPNGRTAVLQWYGGDLPGIEAHLDHLVDLGVDLLYLTPHFPARSSHRYDAATFDHTDPLLGGDEAWTSLLRAAHRRGVRVVGDLTLNHTGSHHDWFRAAQADPAAPEAGFYFFREHPDDYLAWYDVPTLPKLDHRSAALRDRLLRGPESVVGRWLGGDGREPLDGWRIDCANVTARHGDVDLNRQVARDVRATMAAVRPDAWLLAEHCYDPARDLDGDGWHGVMAYQWCSRPLARWLATVDPLRMMSPRRLSATDGLGFVESVRALSAGIPWAGLTASMTMLDSHDSPRFRTLVGGDRELHHVALAALYTLPGVPTLFAGSEVGVGGDSMDTARQPFPWDRDRWDRATVDHVRRLTTLRRAHVALRRGGLRWVGATEHSVTFLREHPEERVLVHLARHGAPSVTFDRARLGWHGPVDVLVGAVGASDERTVRTEPGAGALIARLR